MERQRVPQKPIDITKDPRALDVPVYAETLFPIDVDCSTVVRPALPKIKSDQYYRLRLPNTVWLSELEQVRERAKEDPQLISEYSSYPGAPSPIVYWHSPNYPNGRSYGWRDLSIPSLPTFAPLVNKSGLKEVSGPVNQALEKFERLLYQEWTLDKLLERSPLLREFPPEIQREKLRFFFSTDLTADNALLITVFLEATPQEVATRPPMYVNCNKHLHQSFFTGDGIMRRHPDHHGREVDIASRIEYTAYAKFYIRGFGHKAVLSDQDPQKTVTLQVLPEISILMHPAQRARLSYRPQADRCYREFRDMARALRKFAKTRKGAFSHMGRSDVVETLERIEQHLTDLVRWARDDHTSKLEIKRITDTLTDALLKLPRDSSLRMQNGVAPNHNVWFHRKIRALIGTTHQVWAMHQKRVRYAEAEYQSADDVTGPKRELLFLAVFDMLKGCFDDTGKLRGRRFMLSSSQVANLRLVREDGNVRQKIAVVPLELEKKHPVITTRYPLQKVDENGEVSKRFQVQPISTIDLDSNLIAMADTLPAVDPQLLLFPQLSKLLDLRTTTFPLGPEINRSLYFEDSFPPVRRNRRRGE